MSDQGEITLLLRAVREGRIGASDELVSLIYDELYLLAHRNAHRVAPSEDLSPTALVNEVYIRLFHESDETWENRRHFFFAASRAMRDILIASARRRSARKRGGNARRLQLEAVELADAEANEILELNEELDRLAAHDPVAANVVLLRFFGGLSRSHIAQLLDISESQVWREWVYAKAWVRDRLGRADSPPGEEGGPGEG
ncbi:MAG: ECF-type sigma factor [Phycisphaerales bacterium JB059]